MDESPPQSAASGRVDDVWREATKSLLRVELKRQNLTYEDLAKRLQEIGISETEVSIRNKISRGTFPATFLLQCMHVIGIRLVPLKRNQPVGVEILPELVESIQWLRWPGKV